MRASSPVPQQPKQLNSPPPRNRSPPAPVAMRVSSREAYGLRISRITDGLDCAPASVSAARAGGGGTRAAAQLTAAKAINTGPTLAPHRPLSGTW